MYIIEYIYVQFYTYYASIWQAVWKLDSHKAMLRHLPIVVGRMPGRIQLRLPPLSKSTPWGAETRHLSILRPLLAIAEDLNPPKQVGWSFTEPFESPLESLLDLNYTGLSLFMSIYHD